MSNRKRKKQIKDTLRRIASVEEQLQNQKLLMPVVRGAIARAQIAGITCFMRIVPADFEGFGIFEAISASQARLVRPASMIERDRWLRDHPLIRLILLQDQGNHWTAYPAHRADQRLGIDGPVPVRLVEDHQRFETIQCRFDGAHFWYVAPEPSHDPGVALYLRQAVDRLVRVEELSRRGLTIEERHAYHEAWTRRLRVNTDVLPTADVTVQATEFRE